MWNSGSNGQFLWKSQMSGIGCGRNKTTIRGVNGKNWLDVFFPLWRQFLPVEEQVKLNTIGKPMDSTPTINSVSKNSELINEIKSNFPRIVAKEINTPIEGYTAELVMKDNSRPIFYSAYSVPYKLKESVSNEIDRVCKENIFRPMKFSNWA